MKIKVLGCGTSTGVPIPGCNCPVCTSGKPRNERMRTSSIITTEGGKHILIDATTDLRHQALKHGITHVDAVLFTHSHADHIFGIDDLRVFNYVQRSSIPCYGSTRTLGEIKRCFSYAFDPDERYEGGSLPELTLIPIDEETPFEVLGCRIQPFPMLHGKTPVTGFRFGELAYATDVNFLPPFATEKLRGVRYLFLDGLRFEPHPTHYTITEAQKIAEDLGVEETFLIHMSHTVDYDDASKKLRPGVSLAYDGLEFEFSGEFGT